MKKTIEATPELLAALTYAVDVVNMETYLEDESRHVRLFDDDCPASDAYVNYVKNNSASIELHKLLRTLEK